MLKSLATSYLNVHFVYWIIVDPKIKRQNAVVGPSNASELSMSEPTKDQELIRTLDISLLARKNSFWSFAIRQRISIFVLGIYILTHITLLYQISVYVFPLGNVLFRLQMLIKLLCIKLFYCTERSDNINLTPRLAF